MALKTDIRGMVYEYPDYFVVGREKVREYAPAIKADDPAYLDEDGGRRTRPRRAGGAADLHVDRSR